MKRYLHACLAALLVLVLPSASLLAQKAWSLQECVDYALKNNISVKQNEISTELSRVSVSQNQFALLPVLNANGGRNWNFGRTIDPNTNTFTTQQVESDNLSLNSNVTLFSGFQLVNTLRQSRLNYFASLSDVQKIKNDISLNVVSAYLQVLYAKEQLNVAAARVKQATENRDRVSKMVAAGTMVQGNLLDAEAQLASEDLSRITAENQLALAKLTISQLLQLQTPEGFDVVDPGAQVPQGNIVSMAPAQLYDLALNFLPEVKAAEARIQSAEKGVSIARGSYLPRLTAFGSLSSFYSSSAKQFRTADFNGFLPNGDLTSSGDTVLSPSFSAVLDDIPYGDQFDQNFNRAFGLSLTIPIFNGFTARTNVTRARLNLESAKYAAQLTRNQVYQSIQQALTDANAAKKRYEASQRSQQSFEEAYAYAEKRYNAGLTNSLEFLTATNNLTRTRVELLQAKYDYIFRLKVLDFYAGNPLTF